MAIPKAHISVPQQAKKGDIIPIKILIRHRMETGYRVDPKGRPIARDIVKRLEVRYAGAQIFAMDFTQGVAANPFVFFHTRAIETGDMVFEWQVQDGHVETMRRTLTVTR